jgi:5-methylcytosine-specific restriction protein A
MPDAPSRPCVTVGCPNVATYRGRCPTCATRRNRAREAEPLRDLYASPQWRRLRAQVLREADYICQCDDCQRAGLVLPANTVDHVRPHRGNSRVFWDRANLRAMSAECHSRKTAGEVHRRRASE